MKPLAWLRQRYGEAQDPQRSERRVELVGLVLALLLVLQLLYTGLLASLPPRPAPIPPAAASLAATDLMERRRLEPELSAELRQRPLFWEGRRPLEGAAPEPTARDTGPAELEGISLLGVFGTAQSGGIIARVDGRQQRIRLGEEVKGWTLQAIAQDSAVMVSRRGSATLELERVRAAGGIAEQPRRPAGAGAEPAKSRKPADAVAGAGQSPQAAGAEGGGAQSGGAAGTGGAQSGGTVATGGAQSRQGAGAGVRAPRPASGAALGSVASPEDGELTLGGQR